jgi:hypothetical protein
MKLLRTTRQTAPRLFAALFALLPAALCAQTPEVRQTANSVFINLDSLQKHTEQSQPLPAWISSVEIGANIVPTTVALRMGAAIPRLSVMSGPRLRLTVPTLAPEAGAAPAGAGVENTVPQNAPAAGENVVTPTAIDTTPPATTRIRLRRDAGLAGSLLVRLYFDDEAGRGPSVTAWNEIGDCLFQSQKLGGGIAMTTSESAVVPLPGVSYIEITTPGDGANLHGVLLAQLKDAAVKHGADFGAGPALAEPFDAENNVATEDADSFLYDRVRAVIDDGVVKLPPAGNVGYDFAIEEAPDVAVLTFDVLNGDVANPPDISVNGPEASAVTALLPDLADPAYQATVVAGQTGPLYRYKGWLHCQKVVGGAALVAGDNHIEITSRDRGAEIAVRGVQIQLKYKPTDN